MPLPVDADLLSAALVGNERKLQEINARMADLRQRLGGSSPAPAPAAAPKRILSLAARKRIAAAQRKRWAVARKAKAEAATTPAAANAAKKKRRLTPTRAEILEAMPDFDWPAERPAGGARGDREGAGRLPGGVHHGTR